MGEAERREFANEYGRGLLLVRRVEAGPGRPLFPRFVPLDERLDLVRGVGPVRSARLGAEGFRTVAELARHPKYGREATRLFTQIARVETRSLLLAGARDYELAALFPPGDAAVVDIETVGLARALPLFLIGVAMRTQGGWEIRQYLARSFEEEAAVLRQASLEALERPVCVSYNGKAFDEPYVRSRLVLHGLERLAFRLHVDLLHACRRRFRRELPDCRLTTVAEHFFGWVREDDVPGEAVPDLYFRYVRDGDEGAIRPVLEHNAADLKALAWLYDALTASFGTVSDPTREGGDRAVR